MCKIIIFSALIDFPYDFVPAYITIAQVPVNVQNKALFKLTARLKKKSYRILENNFFCVFF
jgi:hypothetical protein